MSVASYEVGDTVLLTGTFTTNGILVDPTTVTASVSAPDGTVTPFSYPATITKTGTGVYQVAWPVALVGNHQYQLHGAATGYARTVTRTFYARPTAFT
jgi:hypothetical protein